MMLLALIFIRFLYTMLWRFRFGFFFNDTATTEIYTLSLHDALPICQPGSTIPGTLGVRGERAGPLVRSEEHTSELQSRRDLVCRLLLEKKNKFCSSFCAQLFRGRWRIRSHDTRWKRTQSSLCSQRRHFFF